MANMTIRLIPPRNFSNGSRSLSPARTSSRCTEQLQQQREPEKRKPPRPVNVRVKAPPGIGAVQTFSGRHINIDLDGIVEMSEDDAFYLVPAGWTILGDVT